MAEPERQPPSEVTENTPEDQTSTDNNHRLSQFSGIWKDHPDLDEFIENVAEHRRAVEAEQ